MSAIKLRLQDDMKNAMRTQDKQRLGAIRLILAAIKQKEVDERIEIEDSHVLAILEKLRKQRQDSIQQFKAVGRTELVDQEAFEMGVIETYLPAQLSLEEVTQLVKSTITETGASGAADMGKVIAALKPKLQGRADMGQVSRLVKELL